jgi:hypothetical protein
MAEYAITWSPLDDLFPSQELVYRWLHAYIQHCPVHSHIPVSYRISRLSLLRSRHWRSHDLATEPGFHSWQHHYASPLGLRDPALDQLLLCVADDMTDGVILTNHTADWAFHPYDGGAEVFAPNAEAGDQLSATYADWAVPISPEK